MRRNARPKTGGAAAAFHPTDIASLLFMFDAADGPKDVGGNDPDDAEVVTDWLDLSSNGHDLALTGSCVFVEGGGPGGRDAVTFPATGRGDTSTISAQAKPTHIFVVAAGPLSGSNFLYDGVTNRTAVFKSASNLTSFAGSTTCNVAHGAAEDWFCHELKANGASSVARLNTAGGADVTSSTGNIGSNTWGQVRLGANATPANYWDGEFTLFLAFSEILSAGDEAAVRQWIEDETGISM